MNYGAHCDWNNKMVNKCDFDLTNFFARNSVSLIYFKVFSGVKIPFSVSCTVAV